MLRSDGRLKFCFLLASWLGGLAACSPASGQAASPNAGPALARANQVYTSATQAGSRLLNGIEYVNPTPAYVTGKPFFESELPQRGTIEYDGGYFARQPLLYEQHLDQVLLFDSVRGATIQLISNKVASFGLGGHRFVRLPADSAGTLAGGFYDLLLDGPARLLVKRAKRVVETPSGTSITGEYVADTRFFVQQNAHYYEVIKLRQLLSVFADKKPALQKFVRSQHLKFKSASREASIVAVVRQYNELVR